MNSDGRMQFARVNITENLRRPISDRTFVLWCFAAYCLIRVVTLLAVPVVPTSDAAWYVARAIGIAAGEGYHEGPWRTAYWPVGFPAYLGAIFFVFGPHAIAAKIMNLVLSCGIFLLTYRLALHVIKEPLAARLALVLLTFYPNQIAYTGVLFSEMLITFVLLLGIVISIEAETYWRGFVSGLVFGFGTLVKAQMLIVPVIIWVAYIWVARQRLRALSRVTAMGAALALGVACIVLPWTVRNYSVFHQVILVSTNGGRTFLSGNNPEARGDYTPNSPLMAAVRFSVADQVAANERAYALGLAWIRDNPIRFLELIPMKIWRLWAPDGEGEWWYQRGFAGYDQHVFAFRTLRIFNQVYYIGLLALATNAVWQLFRDRKLQSPWAFLGVWLAGYVTIISCIFSGQSRFHFPIMPWVVIYAGWALALVMGLHDKRPIPREHR